ncbi:MAG TPA: type VI secretion system-associated protein TagF [Rhodothermales bacterium]|nr:type VI secretion system-associated protein TagF [Rhodothermales bacterium]
MLPFSFGKLPAFGDFVRVQATGPDVNHFDLWLQEGILTGRTHWESDWELIWRKAPPYHYFYSDLSSHRFLSGRIQTSRDKSGRLFPITFGIRGELQGLTHTLLPSLILALHPAYRKSGEYLDQPSPDLLHPHIEQMVRNLPLPDKVFFSQAQNHLKLFLETTTQAAFWFGIYGDFKDFRRMDLWHQLFNFIHFARLEKNRKFPGIVLPLSASETVVATEVAFWLTAVLRLWGSAIHPTLFWSLPQSRGSRRLLIFLEKPGPDALNALLDSEMGLPAVYPMGYGTIVGQTIPYHVRESLENPAMSLAQIIQKIPERI